MRTRTTWWALAGLATVAAVACASKDPGNPGTDPRGTGGAGTARGAGGGGGDGGSSATNTTAQFLRSSLPRSAGESDAVVLRNAALQNTEFAFDLYGELRKSEGNLFLSPFSITVAMAMAWAGASGTTESEIAKVFHFGDQVATHAALNGLDQAIRVQTSDLVLSLANAVWLAPGFQPDASYLDALAANYGAGVGVVDFTNAVAAANTMDAWVSDQTRGTVPRLLEPNDLPPFTKAVLTNAAYFKGLWETAFDAWDTKDDRFVRQDLTQVPVKMMHSFDALSYGAGDGYQAAALPYQWRENHRFEMVVILPTGDFSAFETSFDAAKLGVVLGAMTTQKVDFAIPRFELRSDFHLKDPLTALGMPTAFSLTAARFPKIDVTAQGLASDSGATKVLHIADVIHQGFVSVNETGTEAAAATAVVLAEDGGVDLMATPPPVLRLDRPFLLLIRDVETSTVVFMGRVVDPTK